MDVLVWRAVGASMTPDRAAYILDKCGVVGLRVYLDLLHTCERRGETTALVVNAATADRLRVSISEVRSAMTKLSRWDVIRRIPGGGWPRYETKPMERV